MQTIRFPTLLLYAVIVGVLAVPIVAWWGSVGDPRIYFTHELPAGQGLYAFAKLAGLLGLVLLWVQAILGLAPRVPFLRELPAISRKAHIRLGMLTVALIASHIGLFVIGSSLRKKVVAWDLLVPNFGHGFYFQSITVGAFALYFLVIALFGGWQARRGRLAWKPVHMLWGPVFVLALVHSVLIGSESRNSVLVYTLFFIVTSLTLVVGARLAAWRRRSVGRNNPKSGGSPSASEPLRVNNGIAP